MNRRQFLAVPALGLPLVAGAPARAAAAAPAPASGAVVLPRGSRPVLLSCKMGMIAREAGGKKLSLVERHR
ncbi:MAG: hypothetical protein ACKO3N_17830 [Verrucomicrobiota bacterium]